MKNIADGQLLSTPNGVAILEQWDNIGKSVRVYHLKSKSPITDFRFNDVSTDPLRVIIKTKGNYMGLNGISFKIKSHSNIESFKSNKSRITCEIFHPELLKLTESDFTLDEVEFVSSLTREDGYYWVKAFYNSDLEIAEYVVENDCFYFTSGSKVTGSNSIFMIDEKQIKRDA
jgi:hypothetical protein